MQRTGSEPTSGIPLVCFPHAGGGRLYYGRWQHLFGGDVDFRVVHYPQRETRAATPMPTSMARLVDDVVEQLGDVLRGGYAVWGHSMGSLVGYEVVRRAQERWGSSPVVFFSSGSSAPCRRTSGDLRELETPEGLRRVLLRYGGVSEATLHDASFMSYFSPIIKADLTMLHGYQDDSFATMECPLVLMEGTRDTVHVDDWSRYVTEPPELLTFEGGHFFIEEHSEAIAAAISSRLQLRWQLRQYAQPTGPVSLDRLEL